MLAQRLAAQPDTRYLEVVKEAAANADFDEVRGAYAYASGTGAALLTGTLTDAVSGFETSSKRWLLGLDWCRTEPRALALLDAQRRSRVRLVDGAVVVARRGCTPRLPWHPKALLLTGPDAYGVVLGSGNMSRNGLTKGHEAVSSLVVVGTRTRAERDAAAECQGLIDWFDTQWLAATNLASVRSEYATRFKAELKNRPPIIDDDVLPTTRRSWMTAERARKVRASDHLWIQAGKLHKNLGQGKPGNQLMMTPMTRIFFGFSGEDQPTNTSLGTVALRYNGVNYPESLRFSDNAMDVLNLPVPGSGGPASYDRETLLFTRTLSQRQPVFELSLGTSAERSAWRRASTGNSSAFSMQSGREWGVF